MTSYRPSAKTLPFVLLGLFGILYIYDAGLEQEKILPEIVSETISVPSQMVHVKQNPQDVLLIVLNSFAQKNNMLRSFLFFLPP